MKKTCLSISLFSLLFCACQQKQRLDLAKLNFTEKAGTLIDFDDQYYGGINNIQAPMAFALQASGTSSFAFNGQPLDSVDMVFQLRSDKIRTDSTLYQGGGSLEQVPVKNGAELSKVLGRFAADSVIYAYRVGIKNKTTQAMVLKELIALYGQGTKNPNTEHGLYWNLKALHRFVFFDRDYAQLLVVDNSRLSKTCFWDITTGDMDMGGCDMEAYKRGLTK